jgi:hypothetical protein
MSLIKKFGGVVTLVVVAGCVDGRPVASQVPPPTGVLVFQPAFFFEDGETTFQGTGFLVKNSDGEVLGVTSAHFIDFDGAAMLSAEWRSILDDDAAASFISSFGAPGNAGSSEPLDLRSDYLILAGEGVAPKYRPLVLDGRAQPEVGERVWLPNKSYEAEQGYELVSGYVVEAAAQYVSIVLDDEIQLQSQSGSPIISQQTGKVIGTLSRGGTEDGKTFLILCPSRSILNVIESGPTTTALRDVIGRPALP